MSEAATAEASEKKKREHPGRQTLPADLPRVERVMTCTTEQCVCQATSVIGYEESEQLDVEPAKYFVQVTRREKRACKSCEERAVVAAPLPERIIEKSLVSDRVIIDTVVSKYRTIAALRSRLRLRPIGLGAGFGPNGLQRRLLGGEPERYGQERDH